MRRALAALFALTVAAGAHAADLACSAPQTQTALAGAMAAAARNEYLQFPGHRIDTEGRIWKFGSVEAETEMLVDAATGKAEPAQPGRYAWRRVWQYWETLGRHGQAPAELREMTVLAGLLDNLSPAGRPQRMTVAELSEQLKGLEPVKADAIRQAIVRTAIVDTPWSGAFISYVMDRAGLTERQFRFAGGHATYIRQAFEQPEGYAYRACDPRKTAPRVGDLLCYSRGARLLADFDAWRAAAPTMESGSVKSHCDLVVSVNPTTRKIEVIGGNVLQSVTLRKLKVNERGLLSSQYRADRYRKRPGGECDRDPTCARDDLNVQYWGVLLQLR